MISPKTAGPTVVDHVVTVGLAALAGLLWVSGFGNVGPFYALVVVVAAVVWAVAVGPPDARLVRAARPALRHPSAEAVLVAVVTVAVLIGLRSLPPVWAAFAVIAVGVGAFAWVAPARSAVPPAVAAACGVAWLATRPPSYWPLAALAVAVVGAAFAVRASLRSLRVMWRPLLALGLFLFWSMALVAFVRSLGTVSMLALVVVAASGALLVGERFAGLERRRRAERERTRPLQTLAEHVAPLLGWRGSNNLFASADGERWLVRRWPDDPTGAGAVICVEYAKGWHGTDTALRQIERAAGLCQPGLWAATVDPGRRWVCLTRLADVAPLPDRLDYTDDPALPVDRIPLGVRRDGQPFVVDLSAEAPHVLVSASTGWGKTSTLNVLVAHVAARGGLVNIADPKRVGFGAFRGLPNVRLACDPADIAAAVVAFAAEMDDRYRLIEAGADPSGWPLRMLVLDEMGSLRAQIRQHWADTKPRGGPANPPTLALIQRILWMGRAARCHVVVAAQQANAKVLGDSDARDQFAYRVAAGPQSEAAAGMLFGPDVKLPDVEARKGRAVVGIGSDLAACQLAYVDADRARRIAARGTARFPEPVAESGPPPASPGAVSGPPVPRTVEASAVSRF